MLHTRNYHITITPTPLSVEGAYVAIPNPSIISRAGMFGGPLFTIPGINTIVGQYNVTGITQAHPSSRFEYLRQVYLISCTDANLFAALKAAYPQYFPHYELKKKGIELADYYPNDYPLVTFGRYALIIWAISKHHKHGALPKAAPIL